MLNSQLRHLIEPPSQPVAFEGDWNSVTEKLTRLPQDYVAMVQAYGAGCFDDFIWFFTPFSQNPNLNLIEQLRRAQEGARSLREDFSEPAPQYFPHPGGLMPFAITDNGDQLCWATAGEPDTWPVWICPARSPKIEVTTLTASQFLLRALGENGGFTSFPSDFPSRRPAFRSA